MDDVRRREQLADFLKTRRARLSPEEAGLPKGTRRRTPGLRREEVAHLANVGVTWYTWLEQARVISPSEQVLEGIARALKLDRDERAHLFTLANRPMRLVNGSKEEIVGPELIRVLEAFEPNPAYVMGKRWDKLAWNRAMVAIFGDSEALPHKERNTVWRMFTNEELRRRMTDWEGHAKHVLAQFRVSAGRYVGDPAFVELIEDLKEASLEFRRWWPRHDVKGNPEGRKELDHAIVGRLVLEHTTFQLHDDPDLKMVLFTPLQESNTPEKLQRLLTSERVEEPLVAM